MYNFKSYITVRLPALAKRKHSPGRRLAQPNGVSRPLLLHCCPVVYKTIVQNGRGLCVYMANLCHFSTIRWLDSTGFLKKYNLLFCSFLVYTASLACLKSLHSTARQSINHTALKTKAKIISILSALISHRFTTSDINSATLAFVCSLNVQQRGTISLSSIFGTKTILTRTLRCPLTGRESPVSARTDRASQRES